jgi:hypothetical protein
MNGTDYCLFSHKRQKYVKHALQMERMLYIFLDMKTKYSIRMAVGLAGYALGLVALNSLYKEQSPYKYGLVLLPVIPLLFTAATVIRAVSEMDEMWRKIVSEAMAFSAIATGFTCFSYLFIRDMGFPEFRAEWAFYMMWAYYGVGTMLSARRYQ